MIDEVKKCANCPFDNPINEIVEKINKEDISYGIRVLGGILNFTGKAVGLGGFFAGFFYGMSILDHYIPVPEVIKIINKWFGIQ